MSDFYPGSAGIFEDDTIISEDYRKKSEVFRRSPKISEDVRSLPKAKLSSPSLRTRINAISLPVLFTSKIRDHEEGNCHLFILHMVFVPYVGLS